MRTTNRTRTQWVELADRNLAECARLCALMDRAGEVEIKDDLQLVASRTRFPAGMFNSGQALGPAPDAAQARSWLERALVFYAARGRGFSIYVRGAGDAALADACSALGMTKGGAPPGMLLGAPVPEPALPAGTRIERVADARGLADFGAVAAAGFALQGLPEKITRGLFTDPCRVLSPEVAYYVAYVDDQPASSALCLLSHGIAGLYWIATQPSAQRRGLGSAITRRASNLAFEDGAAGVILQASNHGEPVYRRIGFEEITRYGWFFMTADQVAQRASEQLG